MYRAIIWMLMALAVAPAWADEDYSFRKAQVNLNQLTREIKQAGLPVHGCTRSEGSLTVHVRGTLDDGQRTQLGQLIDSHTAQPEPASRQDWQARYQAASGLGAKVDLLAEYLGLR